jgi:glycine cleavage system H protein
MPSPKDCRYTPTHEWCRIEGDVATVGITQHAVELLTDLVYVDLPAPGTKVSAGKQFGEVESVKAVSELNSPVSGEVLENNGAAAADLSSISTDPYGRGWLIKVRLSNPGEAAKLMDAAAYDATL